MANKKILLGLTTITEGGWRNKVKEIDELGLKEIALFPTCLNFGQRQELYRLLEKTKLESMPHVHLREQDFNNREITYLIEKWRTEVFNIHPYGRCQEVIEKHRQYSKMIFVENLEIIPANFEIIVKQTGGLCLDLAHWEDYGHLKKVKEYENFSQLVKKYKIGANHLSVVKKELTAYYERLTGEDSYSYSCHNLSDLSELDYVKNYKNYLADIISLELENSFKEQLAAKKYLEKILDL